MRPTNTKFNSSLMGRLGGLLLSVGLLGTALGQDEPVHICDPTCEHGEEGALAIHQVADPAGVLALFDAKAGEAFDLQIFGQALEDLAAAKNLGAEAPWFQTISDLYDPTAWDGWETWANWEDWDWSTWLGEWADWWEARWPDGKWKGSIRNRRVKGQARPSLEASLEKGGTVFLARDGENWEGRLISPGSTEAWVMRGNATEGTIELRSITSVICSVDAEGVPIAGLPPISSEGPVEQAPVADGPQLAEAAAIYHSHPGAPGVIYLNFDGETVSGTIWNAAFTSGADISAAAAPFSSAEIQLIFEGVAEDYRPINVDVTTDRATYDATPINRRTMVIFTPDNEWYGATGGVAATGVFGSATYDDPAWVFVDQLLHNNLPHAPYAAEAASHEAGHTFGLNHDGDSTAAYYEGHGSGATSWAPIMGFPYLATVTQWDRGQYAGANNRQADLETIAKTANGLGFRADDHPSTIGEVGLPFTMLPGNGTPVTGVIGYFTDRDLFLFKTAGGYFSVNAENEATDPNLDIGLRLLDAQGTVVAAADVAGNLDAFLDANLTEGIYYLEVDGVGEGTASTGYTDYASDGAYTLTAQYGNVTAEPIAVSIVSPAASLIHLPVGTTLVLEGTIENGTPSWTIVSSPVGGSATFSAPNGLSTFCEFTGSGVYEIQFEATGVTDSEVASIEVSVGTASPPNQTLEAQTLTPNKYVEIRDKSWAQTFSHDLDTGSYTVSQLDLFMSRKADALPQTISITIRTAWESGILWTGTLTHDELTEAGTWKELSIVPALELTDGTTYFIHAETDSTDGKIYWHHDDSDSYPNGTSIKENGDIDAGKDRSFRLLGHPGSASANGTGIELGPDQSFYFDRLVLNPGEAVLTAGAGVGITWTVISGNATLSNPNLAQPELSFPEFGTATVRLTVDNGTVVTVGEVDLTAKFFTTELVGQSIARAFVPTDASVDGLWQEADFDDTSWQSGISGAGYSGYPSDSDDFYVFNSLIGPGLDLGAEMQGNSSSAYLRVPFQLEVPNAICELTLDMQYDDGFVAYINGVEVARSNVGSPPASGGGGLAVWSPGSTPKFNPWDGSTFGTTENGVGSDRWRIMQGASSPTRDEAIVIGIENGGKTSGMLWNGSAWSDVGIDSLSSVSETFWWNCAVAYEQQSGDAMIVYGDDDSAPYLQYKIWNGTSWSDAVTVDTWNSGAVRHMRLAANPNSDEMVLVVNAVDESDYVLVWDGDSWGAPLLLDASTAQDRTDIYVAYESTSGHAMVVYETNSDSNLNYRTWNGTAWSNEGSVNAPAGVNGYSRWTVLGSDPRSDKIVLGVQTGSGPDGWVSIWDGSSWGSTALLTPDSLDLDQSVAPNLGVAFEGTSGHALAVWGQTNAQDVLFSTWNGSSWSSPQLSGRIDKHTGSLILAADSGSDRIMLAVQDDSQDLNFVQWDGDGWGTTHELETSTGETKNQPFVFLWSAGGTPAAQGALATEDFSSGGYTGGSGWSDAWTELSDDGNAASGDVSITGGRLKLQLSGSGAVRSLDLSSQTSAELGFDMQTFENGDDYWQVEANDGSGWVTIEQINPIGGPGATDVVERNETKTYQLENFISLTSNVQLRFRVAQGYGQIGIQYLTLDNIRVEGTGGGGFSGGLAWNSTAGSERDDNEALTAESFRFAVPAGLLVEGRNILAVHGLNATAASSDELFLIRPVLRATVEGWPVFSTLGGISNVLAQDFHADPDGDGLSNLVEHATGNEPELPEVGLLDVYDSEFEGLVDVRLRLPVNPPADVRYELICRNSLYDPWTVIATREGAGPWSGTLPLTTPLGSKYEVHSFLEAELKSGFYKLSVTLINPTGE